MSTLDNYANMRQELQRDGYVQSYARNGAPVFVGPTGDHVRLKWVGPGVFIREEIMPSPAWVKRQKALEEEAPSDRADRSPP